MWKTVKRIRRKLGLKNGYSPAKVKAAYVDCLITLGYSPELEWFELTAGQRSAMLKELRLRNRNWVCLGAVPEVQFFPGWLENVKRKRNPQEIVTAETLANHGITVVFQIDEVPFYDCKKGLWQVAGFADLFDSWEIKVLNSASSYNTINDHIKAASKKEDAAALVLDNSRNSCLSDENLASMILRSRSFKDGRIYIISQGKNLLRIK